MTITDFNAEKALGKKIIEMSRQELCEFISKLCARIVAEVGTRGRRGGIYPENISIDDDGAIGIGHAGVSPWAGEELKYVAPELYWNGKVGAPADVYSVGLLLYYAISGGRLPCEGECEDPQLRRMSGDDVKAPQNAGVRLGEIIERALRFKPEQRYQTLEELRVVIESCLKNLYLCGIPSAEAIFKKNDDDLSEIERMMVNIIERTEPEERAEPVEEEIKVYTPAPARSAPRPPAEKKAGAVPAAELKPITPAKKGEAHAFRNAEREKKIEEELKKRRRRPLAFILVLCAILVIVAIVFDAILKDFRQSVRKPDNTIDVPVEQAEVTPYNVDNPVTIDNNTSYVDGNNSSVTIGQQPGEQEAIPSVPSAQEHRYEIYVEDVSWVEAKNRCDALGGHLVVIGSEEELQTIVAMAELAGVDKIWIGCHRLGDTLVWESEEEPYYKWAKGEPSYTDQGVSEDYIMLWNNRGWAYNDNRLDPVADFPQWYSGTVAYICEYGK